MAQPYVSVSPNDTASVQFLAVYSSFLLSCTYIGPADWTAAPSRELSFDATNTVFLTVVLVNQDTDLEGSEFMTAFIQLVQPVDRVILQPDMARVTITDSSREC